MAGYQNFTIVGNVGRDPTMKYTPNGAAVCDFSVAVTRRFGSGDQRQEKTLWVRVSCWNKLAEVANSYVRKGTQILVVGTVEVNAYMDKNNQPQASLELRADNFQLLGSRDGAEGGAPSGQGGYNQGGEDFDQIPF
ncbi:MAG: single-stranded DNA-binding protein [Anaerolineae bacterium]